jgi:hypothetical protein
MSEFLNELNVKVIDDGNYMLLSSLKYRSDIYKGVINVPRYFKTDFASVPRVPIIYYFFGNLAHHEAVIHDFLYRTQLTSRLTADRIFLEAMKVRGKPFLRRWCMFLGVRIGGKKIYNSYTLQ